MKMCAVCLKNIVVAAVVFAGYGITASGQAFSQTTTLNASSAGNGPLLSPTMTETTETRAATPAAPALLPPGAATAPSSATTTTTTSTQPAGSALPEGGALPARSPGLELPAEAGIGSGPTGAGSVRAPRSNDDVKNEIREDSFNAAMTGLLPLEPPEIRKILKRFDETKEATETPIYPYPEPENVVKNVSLDPGVHPIELKLAVGNVTTINVLDVTGAPWPIGDMTWAGNFEVVAPGEGGHVFRITPMSEFAYGNISIRLVGLKTPVTFTLRTHRDTVYYRVDARMPEYGPYAKPPIIDNGVTLAAGDASMTAVLDGVVPDGADKMDVSGVDGRTTAYKFNETIFVRTPLTLLSPAWTSSIKSADGMNVYALDNASVILLSDRGRMMRAKLSERNDKK